jgi:hypothetical protein
MDVSYFLHQRTRLIRSYYETASLPFRETLRKIEAEVEPFVPPYSEDPEPAFLTEWLEARDFLEITGRTCVSMLAGSLSLFLEQWDRELGLPCKEVGRQMKKNIFENGKLHGYRQCFETISGKSWNDCPANLDLIEQVVLARNRDQHPEAIWGLGINHSEKDREKFPSLFFVEEDARRDGEHDGEYSSWMTVRLHVSGEKLEMAIREVESLAVWLEDCLVRVRYPNYKGS